MKYRLKWPSEFQELERRFIVEIEDLEKEIAKHKGTPSGRILERNLELIRDTLDRRYPNEVR